jgi:predicted ArsR family transcriptional regulator
LNLKTRSLNARWTLSRESGDQLRADVAQITKSNELDETEKNLLKALATTDAANAQTLASHVGTDPVRAEYYLQKLEQGEYIYGQHFMGSASLYSLGQRGREFLIKNRLI